MNDETQMQPLPPPQSDAPAAQWTEMRRNVTAPDDAARAANIHQWQQRIKAAKEYHKKSFDRMRKDMTFATFGYDPSEWDEDSYHANVIQRVIGQSVAALYARNPTAVAKRKPRLMYRLWDGNPQTLAAAVQAAAPKVDPMTGQPIVDPMTGQPIVDPTAQAMVQEVAMAQQQNLVLDRTGKTLSILFNYYVSEQDPNFKQQLKQMVRRTKVCGIGYTQIGFQRVYGTRPDIAAQIDDMTMQIARLKSVSADLQDGEMREDDPQVEEMRQSIAALEAEQQMILREGPVFDFPKSTEIIMDPATRNIKGWVGANWLVREYIMSADEVKDVYGVDLGTATAPFDPGVNSLVTNDREQGSQDDKKRKQITVWRVQDRKNGIVFVIADGFPDYVKSPTPPDVDIPGFFDIVPLTFNDIEDEKQVFPMSDVTLMRSMQKEYNRAREGLREHRYANRPTYVTGAGQLEESDKQKLGSANRPANTIIELKSLGPDDEVAKKIQRFPNIGIDPNQYNVADIFEDILRVVGSSEADSFGTANNDITATGESIAQQSRTLSLASNIDDLDEHLGAVARATGAVLLRELSKETVTKIVGPGAVWPEYNREQVAEEIYLDIKAGSSGRPNQAAELANRERAMPWLVQIPGVNPTPILKDYLELLNIDVDEAIVEGLPSIVAQNSMAGQNVPPQPQFAHNGQNPAQQGGHGAHNVHQPPQNIPPGQAQYPAGQQATTPAGSFIQ